MDQRTGSAATASETERTTLLPEHGGVEEGRRVHFARAALVGALAGCVAVAFQGALATTHAWRLAALAWALEHGGGGAAVFVVGAAAVVAAAVWATARFAPEAAGSGIPHVKGVLLGRGPMRWARILLVKFFAGAAAIGAGLSLGREGPTVQLGAAVGAAVASRRSVPKSSASRVISCGAGAGLAAAFNAPLAGFVFVIEELRREISTRTYGSALIATLVADMVSRLCVGQRPAFHVRNFPTPPLSTLPVAALIGVAAGVIGIAFAKGVLWAGGVARRRAYGPPWLRGAIVGAVVGACALALPAATGGGHDTAESFLAVDRGAASALGALALIVVAKFGLTLLSYATGAPGGIFMPMLVIGAGVGVLVGGTAQRAVPSLAEYPVGFAMIGMAAIFSGVVRAPLTGVILIVEMTGNYDQIYALAIAALTAYLLAERFGPPPIYEALLHAADAANGARPAVHESALHHFVVEPGAPVDGRRLRDAGLPAGCLVVSLRRAGALVPPHGDTLLMSGDEVTVASHVPDAAVAETLDRLMRAAA
jgi:CIC family chloride channel protein